MPLSAPTTKPFVGTSTAIATRYWCSEAVQVTTATGSPTADRLYAQPFNLPGLVIDRIGVETTAGAGNAKIGIYENANGVPGALLVDGGIIDVSTIATIEATISAFILPERVWIAAIFSGTPTVRTGVGGMPTLGHATPGTGARGVISTGAQTYAGGLPANAPALSLIGTCPLFLVRKS